MNFFQWQDDARKKTKLLVFIMLLTVVLLAVVPLLICAFLASYFSSSVQGSMSILHEGEKQVPLWLDPWLYLNPFVMIITILVVALVVGLGSWYKSRTLSRQGGAAIAVMLGGRFIVGSTQQPDEKRLLNVVEEMAIASGIQAPRVCVLDNESGINAFAAGYRLDDAVIGVTRGTLEQLSRDELEGVIAHEFSHIAHGDMRLNMQLLGMVFGITMIAHSGRVLLYHSNNMYGGWAAVLAILSLANQGRNSNRSGVTSLLGLILLIVGSVGSLAGKLIKASVSRTREYLADAAAVQYTRNPDGISGALKRIGGFKSGSQLDNPEAVEVSHMLFEAGFVSGWGQMFASHPPLADRIKKLDPQWSGRYPKAPKVKRQPAPSSTAQPEPSQAAELTSALASAATASASAQGAAERGAAARGAAAPGPEGKCLSHAMKSMGEPQPEHINYARDLLQRLPAVVASAAHSEQDAPFLLLALLLDLSPEYQVKQLEAVNKLYGNKAPAQVQALAEALEKAEIKDGLAVLEITLPRLRNISLTAGERLYKGLSFLARADGKVSLYEWALLAIVRHYLDRQAEGFHGRQRHYRYKKFKPIIEQVHLVLAAVCSCSGAPAAERQKSFNSALVKLGLPEQPIPVNVKFNTLYQAILECGQLYPKVRQQLLEACCGCAEYDDDIVLSEAQAIRAIAVLMECPLPPLVYSQAQSRELKIENK